MSLIGENIHIISPSVKQAIAERDENFILDLVKKQLEAGVDVIDLNIGPAKGPLEGSMKWLIELVQGVGKSSAAVNFSLDTTSLAELKSGFEVLKNPTGAFLNSASAVQERLENTTKLAAKYGANLIALTLGEAGIPKTAEERFELAYTMVEVANAQGIENNKIYLDPLVLPVCVDQTQAGTALESIRMFKESFEPEVKTVVGLSNISNGCTKEFRPLINRVFFTLALGAGLDCAIVDSFDTQTVELHNCLKNGTAEGIYAALYDMSKNFGELEDLEFDKTDPEQVKVFKTAQILLNKEIYTHSYLGEI